MKKVWYLAILLLLVACKKEDSTTGKLGTGNVAYENVNIADYKLEDVPGTNWQRATKVDGEGKTLEVGYFENGKKTGSWLTYDPAVTKLFPQQMSNYKDGKLNGLHMQFNQGGQTELIAFYENNNLHGSWGKYRFSRLVEEATYKNGKLEGIFNIYTLATGKLERSAEYKNGVQDGFFRTYSPDGKITSEYQYKNGQQVSGNTIDSTATSGTK